MKTILAADIGGTNSRFAHFETDLESTLALVDTLWLPTDEADSFVQLLEQLRSSDFSLPADAADMAVIAVAGPVEQASYCAPPYIDWDIDLASQAVANTFKKAILINDFVAQAYASRSPAGQSARTILPGKIIANGTVGVIGAGTALGKALLVPIANREFLALPSEGGHGYFPFVSQREFAFQQFYREKSGQKHITGNLVVSGRGLRYLHWFLSGEDLAPEEVTRRLSGTSETQAWAARFYGRVCRDFALAVLARGGLYIAGGVAARTPEMLTHENFSKEFLDSPTMGHMLSRMPVFLMDDQDSGLWGAAFHGQQMLRKG
ncbi:glucokinase [Desulfosarcina sp.]|uniref:glucokinase n=1 Tax=Desulfosarcina sp. TaxID=2027861 RepID=UPI003561FEDD